MEENISMEVIETIPTGEVYSMNPYVVTHDNFLTTEECQHFINISKEHLKRAEVSYEKEGGFSKGRTGSNTWIAHDHDVTTHTVGLKIAKLANMPLENAEKYQIIYYGPDQEYRQHYDSWEHNGSEKTLRCMKYGGARLKTALVYLCDVEEGGGTRMTKLDHTIMPHCGKVLLFDNTYKDSHIRHPDAEHAGMPVLKGEKYAFNLWFKECNSKMLYKDFNPEYYLAKDDKILIKDIVEGRFTVVNQDFVDFKIKNHLQEDGKISLLHMDKDIVKFEHYLQQSDVDALLSSCTFSSAKRPSAWIKLKTIPQITTQILACLAIDKASDEAVKFCENMNVVKYGPGEQHGPFLDAYDVNTERGQKYLQDKGQRILTFTIIMSDAIEISFPNLGLTHRFTKGDMLLYKNSLDTVVINEINGRDINMGHALKNVGVSTGYVANVYIRERNITINRNKRAPKTFYSLFTLESNNEVANEVTENYMETLNHVLTMFQNNKVNRSWGGLDSFKYLFKGDFSKFKQYILEYKTVRDANNSSILNQKVLDVEYTTDPDFFMLSINDVIVPEALAIFKKYYKETINAGVWQLGDKQSNRYKSHNEPISRFLHYEVLPLIEKITGRVLQPTYTYMSAYVKEAELPGHTDRADCEYTVSFVVDKPDGSEWNIYVHKIKQPVKHKGRYPENPPKEECVPVDCDAGGLMIFQGTDRIHFREKLEHDYYNIVLLHYCSV
jgi:hypothetical protein